MRINYTFTEDDEVVIGNLKETERNGINTWQTSDDYTFEFHLGHGTGYPIYIRPEGNTDTSNLPKFDTKNKYAHNYSNIQSFANSGKLQNELSQKAQTDLLAVIRDNWDLLQTSSKRMWEGEDIGEGMSAMAIWAKEETADPIPQDAEISIKQFRRLNYGLF